jgi:hypothetical protein
MTHLELLELRRRALLERCERQRAELGYRLEKLSPSTQLARLTNKAARWTWAHAGSPLTFWGVTLGLAILILKPRKLLGRLAWVTGALSLLSRASQLLRLIGQWREIRAGFR